MHLGHNFLHVHDPFLNKCNRSITNGFKKPQLPSNFVELDQVAEENVRVLHTAQTIWGLYQIFLHRKVPELLRKLRYRNTLLSQIMALIASIFHDGEAYVQSVLFKLRVPKIWKTIVKANE